MSIAPEKSLYFRIHGAENNASLGAPIVLLHGLMGFAANWGKIWPKLENRKVLVLDQRGHGRSFKAPSGEYAPEYYAEDLKNLLEELQWKNAHIVGHSMGGRVALRFASLFPEKTISLTLEDSGMESNPDRVSWIKKLLHEIPTPFSDREQAKRFFESHFSSDPMTGSFLHANLETKTDGKLDWRFFPAGMIETVLAGRATDAMEELKNISAPTLIIRGERSKEFPAEEAARMQLLRENIQLKTVPGAGHFVHAEKPEEFARFLNEFLQEHEPN